MGVGCTPGVTYWSVTLWIAARGARGRVNGQRSVAARTVGLRGIVGVPCTGPLDPATVRCPTIVEGYFLNSADTEGARFDRPGEALGVGACWLKKPTGSWGVPHHPFVCSSLPFTRCSTLTSFQFTIRLVGPP